MHNKIAYELLLSFLLLSTISLLFITKPVHAYTASNIIYIRSTGAVDPSTAPIIRTGDLYTLTADITSSLTKVIYIQNNNIVLDGAGFTVHGSLAAKSYGIYVPTAYNVTIRRLTVESCDVGIYLYYSSSTNITRNKLTSNNYGMRLDTANYNSIICNNITSNSWESTSTIPSQT